jgi:protein involved in polysaccharide export with SLBB domain
VALKSTIPNAGSNSKTLSATPTAPTSNASHAPLTALTQLYRVGVGDILDIQISENPGRSSTLFTVQDGGMLDYPLAGGAVAVSGMTTAEVARVLKQQIKYFSNPTVLVKVRDYSSHSVTINGFVVSPGQKILRREAVPLYVVLSEAMPLPEASQAVIIRKGRAPIVIKLADTKSASTLVVAGDLIRVSSDFAVPTEFFFAGGAVNSPGQKAFHTGLTLTQAILASGGLTKNAATTVRLSRQLSNGRLVVTEYDLALIQNGKEPDPALQNGDRIEVRLK